MKGWRRTWPSRSPESCADHATLTPGRYPGPVMFWFRPQPGGAGQIKRRVFSFPTLVTLVVAGAFLAFLVTRFDVDVKAIWGQVRSSNPWYLALAVAVHYTTFIFRGARWRLLLRNAQGKDCPVPGVVYCGQLLLLGWFANSVGWFRMGDAYRAYLYRDEQDASFSRTIGTILAERMLDAVLVLLLLLAVFPFLIGGGQGALWTVGGIAVALVVLLVAFLTAMVWSRVRLLRALPGWLAERYQRFLPGRPGQLWPATSGVAIGCAGLAGRGRASLYGGAGARARFGLSTGGFHRPGQLPACPGALPWRSGCGGVGCRLVGGTSFQPIRSRCWRPGGGRPGHQLRQHHHRGHCIVPASPGVARALPRSTPPGPPLM